MTTKFSLDIVTHCWSGQDVDIYHWLLKMQVRSLISACEAFRHNCRLIIVHTPSDERTVDIVKQASQQQISENFEILELALPENKLFRRAIGRNIAAKRTEADVVWFTDCDHLFTKSCLDDVIYHQEYNKNMYDLLWPCKINISSTHTDGDELIRNEEVSGWGPLTLNKANFHIRNEPRAIGGLQIVTGDYCRTHGYLHNSKWTRPVESDHFLSCKCDVPFRRKIPGDRKAGVLITNLYRVRHSRTGRDKGKKDHGTKTRGKKY